VGVLGFTTPWEEPGFVAWKGRLRSLPRSGLSVRTAVPTPEDGRWLRWMQADCESLFIHSIDDNVSRIDRELVSIAEIDADPVGFCIALVGPTESDPLFLQQVAVVPLARRRGAGLALLKAVGERAPRRDIAMATLDENEAAHALNEKLAKSIGASIRRVPLRQYRRSQLGFAQGERHRPWLIERSRED
jgi:GNAT superfamily N-acetyltransferase